jgi:hypothetical protein
MSTLRTDPIKAANVQQLLFVGRSLNFQSTADQALTKQFSGTNYVVTNVIAKQVTGGASVTCAGGVYDATAKGGNAIVATAQSWVTLAANVIIPATVVALTPQLSAAAIYLSLTTGSTAAVTGDVFVFGFLID